jgi:predicted dehydrogenase
VSAVLRVGVVGGGLIAQAVHLPNLAAMPERFAIGAIADPSQRVREALAARHPGAAVHADWRDLIEREQLDAVVVCAPRATHAAVVRAALDSGLHVFVEKPLCISIEDADSICERTAAGRQVVQVGYMKRYTRAYEAFLEALPGSGDGLRLVDVVTYDPWMAREPFVPWSAMTPADDVPAEVLAAGVEDERRQVAQAVGADDPETVRAYSDTFLACLVHDVNLVHGALDRLGVAEAQARESAAWAGGEAASASLRLPGGALWRTSWMLLRGLMTFEERARLYFDDAIHELVFPAPYHVQSPVAHRISSGGGAHRVREAEFVDDPYRAELEHFHDCIVGGETCRTPPEQARRDLVALRDLYLSRT